MVDGEMHRDWGRKVRRAREQQGWTQRQLAELASVDVATISRIERGIQSPREGMKWRLAGALSKTVEELFAYPAVRPPFPQAVGQ